MTLTQKLDLSILLNLSVFIALSFSGILNSSCHAQLPDPDPGDPVIENPGGGGDPPPPLTLSLSASPNPVLVGHTVTVIATAGGGVPPYT